MNAIECRDLTKSYQGFTLDHITFTLPAGCILGLVGENGAGKSTTLKLLMNATSREDGQVSLLGTDNQSPDFLQTKQDIGVVLDEACLPEVITPLELGKLMSLTYTRWDQPLYESYLTRFDIPRTKQFKDFSRGMKMKLAIAAALSHGAKLLLLDEATSGLDPMVRDEVLDVFNEFTRDETHTVVLSSHIVSDLEKICDYIAFLHKGKLILFEDEGPAAGGIRHCKTLPRPAGGAGPIRSGWREAGPLWGRGPGQTEPDSRRLRHRAHHLRRYHPLFGQTQTEMQ